MASSARAVTRYDSWKVILCTASHSTDVAVLLQPTVVHSPYGPSAVYFATASLYVEFLLFLFHQRVITEGYSASFVTPYISLASYKTTECLVLDLSNHHMTSACIADIMSAVPV